MYTNLLGIWNVFTYSALLCSGCGIVLPLGRNGLLYLQLYPEDRGSWFLRDETLAITSILQYAIKQVKGILIFSALQTKNSISNNTRYSI
jgi:hypothetical protein